MKTIKSITAALFNIVFFIPVFAQTQDSMIERQKNNLVKLNLSALIYKNISVEYERKIAKKITVAANVHFIPYGKLPFLSQIERVIDDPDVPLNKFNYGSFGVAPEIRFYLGKKGAFRGFYLAPFANFTNYKTEFPIDYSNDTKTGLFSGNLSTITGGLLLGAQWKLSNSLYLDWWIIGPNYGTGKGDLNFNGILSSSDQTDLINQIEDLIVDAPFDKIIESYNVNNNGAYIKVKGPWGGLRGMGFNLGIRF